MKADVIQRLRAWNMEVGNDAADEIVRLRQVMYDLTDRGVKMEEEIERLRRELAEARGLLREVRPMIHHEDCEALLGILRRLDRIAPPDQPTERK